MIRAPDAETRAARARAGPARRRNRRRSRVAPLNRYNAERHGHPPHSDRRRADPARAREEGLDLRCQPASAARRHARDDARRARASAWPPTRSACRSRSPSSRSTSGSPSSSTRRSSSQRASRSTGRAAFDPGLRGRGRPPREGHRQGAQPPRQGVPRQGRASCFARALQHEIDHLNGTLYIDHLDSLEELVRVSEAAEEVDRRGGRRHLVAGLGRIAFLGTGAFGVPLLSRVAELADDLAGDQPAGSPGRPPPPAPRDTRSRPALASTGFRVLTPHRLRSDEAGAAVRAYAPDGLVLVAYGQLVPQALLEVAERPPLNVHPSLLPRHRGAAPVAGTILAGDQEGGVTLMVMTAELDAGPIVATLAGAADRPRDDSRARGDASPTSPPRSSRRSSSAGPSGPIDRRATGRRSGHLRPSIHPRGRLDRLAAPGDRDRPPGSRAPALARRMDHGRRPPDPCPASAPGRRRRRHPDRGAVCRRDADRGVRCWRR